MTDPRTVPWVFFDLETTGVDPATDRIVSMYFLRVEPNAPHEANVIDVRVNPRIPIPAEATAVHGITDADVNECETFGHYADQIEAIIDGAVLCGFNSRRFDVPLLEAALLRAGRAGLKKSPEGSIVQPEVDLYQLWVQSEPRTLVAAAARFANIDHGGAAHEAAADTAVLPFVFYGMLRIFNLGGASLEDLMSMSAPADYVDREGKFRIDDDGCVVFGFGKHKGTAVEAEPGYLDWMLSKDFSADTKAHARRILARIRGTLL